jgi:hypothetical protein
MNVQTLEFASSPTAAPIAIAQISFTSCIEKAGWFFVICYANLFVMSCSVRAGSEASARAHQSCCNAQHSKDFPQTRQDDKSPSINNRLRQHRMYLQRLQERTRKHKLEQTIEQQRVLKRKQLLAARILDSGSSSAQPVINSRDIASHSLDERRSAPTQAYSDQDAKHVLQCRQRDGHLLAPRAPPQRSISLPAALRSISLLGGKMCGLSPGAYHQMVEYKRWRERRRIPQGTPVFCMAGSGRHSGMIHWPLKVCSFLIAPPTIRLRPFEQGCHRAATTLGR